MGASMMVLTFLLIFGYINAVPYFDFTRMSPSVHIPHSLPPPQQTRSPLELPQMWSVLANNPFATFSSFDHDAESYETVEQRTEGPSLHAKPFEVDVVTSDVPQNQGANVFFQHSFPFYDSPIFSSFGGFGFGSRLEPWWKGPNVCTDREEEEDMADTKETGTEISSSSESDVMPPALFSGFHFSLNSCVEKHNKHICTKTLNRNGEKKTLTVKKQCCHGYGRPRNADVTTPCAKVEIKNIEQTATDMGAKEFINSVKQNIDLDEMFAKDVTLFAPTDEAYNEFADQVLNENNLVVSRDQSGMPTRELILNHAVDGIISLDDISNEDVLKTKNGEHKIRINAYQMPPNIGEEPFRYTANCAPIVKHDKMAEKGMIHTVSKVIKPVKMNVMDIIRQRSDMAFMRNVLEKTNLSELLEGDKPVTVFVPNDFAFEKLDNNLRKTLKEGKGCALNILKNHMLDLTFCSVAAVAKAKTTAYNLLGEPMHFNRSDGKSEISNLAGEQQVIINGIARIVESDLMGSNGVVHVIDTILPTATALPITTLMKQKNVTIFKNLIDVCGLQDKFDDFDNVTVFAPTDKAFEESTWIRKLNESPEELRNNEECKNFLNYHVVQTMTKTCDLTEKLIPTVAGSNLRVNLYSTHSLFTNVMNRATVNCARLVHFDDESCGSVLHQVDKLLSPPKMNLLKMLESNPNYSKFLSLVQSANLTNLLENMSEGYTLLVPKNDVFDEVEDWQHKLSEKKSELEDVVKTHIVNDVVCCAGIIPTNWPFVRSIEAVNGNHLRITRDRRPKIENAGITKCDTIATNGIIHEINDVIVPRKPQNRPHHNHHQQQDAFEDIFF